MKSHKFLLPLIIFVGVMSQKVKNFQKEDFAVLKAIVQMLEVHYVREKPNIQLIFCGNNSEILARNLLREMPMGISVQPTKLETLKKFVIVRFPAIILLDSEDYTNELRRSMRLAPGAQYYENLLYYIPHRGFNDFFSILENATQYLDTNMYLKVIDDTTVDLVASFMFEPGKCRQAELKTINRFSLKNMKWSNETFFPRKFENFNGCTLVVGNISTEYNEPGHWDLISVLAKTLNFKPELKNYTYGSPEYDLLNIISPQTESEFQDFDISSALFMDFFTCTVPTGVPYTQFEKMFIMFDKETWICIFATLVGAFLVIQVINRMSVQVQKFVFGRTVQTPTLNVAEVFLVGLQSRLPGRNFARYMLMMFIIWTMIIRTCYQSILYKNLQKDMRKPMIRTLKELKEQNFTFAIQIHDQRMYGKEFFKE